MLLFSGFMHISCLGEEAAEKNEVSSPEIEKLLLKGKDEDGQKQYKDALSTYKEALLLADKSASTGLWLKIAGRVAKVLDELNDFKQTEALYREILETSEKFHGKEAPETAIALGHLAEILRELRKVEEAESLLRRSLAITEATYGKNDPHVALRLSRLAAVLDRTASAKEVEALLRRALEISEAAYGKNDPKIAIRLDTLALQLIEQKDFFEAELMLQRALKIVEDAYGKDDPKLGNPLGELALLFLSTKRYHEAEPLQRRMLEIFVKDEVKTGQQNKDFRSDLKHYADLLRQMGDTPEQIKEKVDKITEPLRKK